MSAMILSVRQSTRRFLTTFSVFTSVSPQHEANNDTKRESGRKRGDGTIRYDVLDVVFLFAQGRAEIIQRGLDLVGESIGAILRGVENTLARCVQETSHVIFERLQLIYQPV
jgi:hypothetical protein